jgi:hypothetical protein
MWEINNMIKTEASYLGSSSNAAPWQINSIPSNFCASSSEENSTTLHIERRRLQLPPE